MEVVLDSVAAIAEQRQWLPLKIFPMLSNTTEDIDANIASCLSRKYLRHVDLVGTQSGAVSVVGSGPSLKANWRRLLKFKGDIIACNAAYQFLLERGITPKYMFCFDADPLMLEFITPHPDVKFLIGSRCPPKTFDLLKDCEVYVWHAAGDTNIEALLQKAGKFDEPMVIGGTAAITRSMVLAQTLGYSDVHLWGADSSFLATDTHIRQSTTKEKHSFVSIGGRAFETAPWMAQQLEDFKLLAPQLSGMGIRFHVHGDGALPQVAASMGYSVDLPLAVRQFVRTWLWRARTLWSHI